MPEHVGDIVPFELHGKDGLSVRGEISDEAVLARKLQNLPDPIEAKQWIALGIIESVKQITMGNLPFRNAGEASKVARDLAAVAKDLGFLEAEKDEQKKAESDVDRKDAFEMFRKKANKALGEG